MDVQDIFDRAYELITINPVSRGHYARDRKGSKVMTDSKQAVCFDAPGALYRAALDLGIDTVLHNETYQEAVRRFHEHVNQHYQVENLSYWSDQTDEGEIREMFARIATPTLVAAHA